MRWIRRLLHRRPKPTPQHSDMPSRTPGPTPGQQAAESALSRSQQARKEIKANWPEVTHRSRRFKSERKKNHFAELFRSALEGGHH
ncbi:DUF7620 family protein [Streptomyces pseudovenezuelae]